MITNIYEFYLEDGDKDQPKDKLQEITQVDSYIDVELNTPDIKLEERSINEVESTPKISNRIPESINVLKLNDNSLNEIKSTSKVFSEVPKSLDISDLTSKSKRLGETAADLVISLISPAVNKVKESISEVVNSSLSTSDPTIAKVTEGYKNEDPVSNIISQYRSNIEGILIEAIDELIISEPKKQAEVANAIELIQNNDIAEESFELKLKENLYRQIDINSSMIDNYKDLGSHIKSELSKIWTSIIDTSIDTISHVSNSLLNSIAKTIDAVVIDSWMDPVKGIANATNQALNVTNEVITELTNQLNGIMNNFKTNEDKVIRAFTTDLVGTGKDWIRDKILDPVDSSLDKLNATINNLTNNFISRLPWEPSLTGSPKITYNSRVNSKSFMGNNWNYLRRYDPDLYVTYYRFSTTFDWLIRIVPSMDEMPSLNSLLGIGKNEFLPVTNYTLMEAGLESVAYQVLANTIVIPQDYKRPSKLSITLPDMYVDNTMNEKGRIGEDGKTYLRKFKERFINYVKSVNEYPKYSLVSRDYRECYYRITLYRFPYVSFSDKTLEDISFHKTYLGIPEISISESGNELKQLITEVLTFNIVGEMN